MLRMNRRLHDISITPGFAAVFAAAVFYLDNEELICLLLSAAVHEAGHLGVMRLFGVPVLRIEATALGLNIGYGNAAVSYLEEAFLALSGPIAGLGAAFLFSAFDLTLPAGMSAALSLFNLLPAYPLDGGRTLRAVLCRVLGERAGLYVSIVVGIVTATVLVVFGVLYKLGLLPIIFGLWLIIGYCKNLRDGVL